MGKISFLVSVSLLVLALVPVWGSTWYVDGSVSASGDGKAWATAFKTIQEGIDAATHGDTVIVGQGTYVENIEFNGKNIVLTSTDPLDPAVVASTIIDGNKAGSVVTFSGTEGEACVLKGFTIRDGKADNGGGIFGNGTHAAIQHNAITANRADRRGGGLYACHGTIQNSTITANSAHWGGGLDDCDGTIRNSTIAGNSAGRLGGGLFDCDAAIHDNTITENSAGYWGGGLSFCSGAIQNNRVRANSAVYGGGLMGCGGTVQNNAVSQNSATWEGGGLESCHGTISNNAISANSAPFGGGLGCCSGTIQNNTITGNWAEHDGGGLDSCNGIIEDNAIIGNSAGRDGGGLWDCRGTIENNTITTNSAEWDGGLDDCDGMIRNCIIWGNTAPTGPQHHESSIPTYSCIEGWGGDSEYGNISQDPQFVDPDGPDNNPETWDDNDYRLLPDSPCIDAGKNEDWMWEADDLDGKPRVADGDGDGVAVVDMGAYEYSSAGGGHVFGIDVSALQGSIDWGSVKGARITHSGQTFPIMFALIRASKGNADSGTDCSFKDPSFDTNAKASIHKNPNNSSYGEGRIL